MGNMPTVGVDPDGQFAWFVPIIIGAATGGILNGVKSDLQGKGFGNGFWKGAIVGAVGGAFSLIGTPATLGGNILLGAGEGALTGGLDAALNDGNLGKGLLYGAGTGAAFGFFSSQHFKNSLRGKGLRNNDAVLKSFVDDGNYQGALNYFGFEAKYDPLKPRGGEYVESDNYWGATSPSSGEISFGNSPFSSYDNLRATYLKETFTSQRVKNGIELATQEPIGTMKKYFPEERLGFIHVFKNIGLIPKTSLNISSHISFYELSSHILSPENYFSPSKFQKFLYQIPRRWNVILK